MYARAVRTGNGKWEVACCDCKKSIGTLDGEGLARAMWFALSHGGIKCPKCRKNSCGRCHIYLGKPHLCTLCKLELRKENGFVYGFLK